MKEIQEWLDHSNFSITANTYAHLDTSSKNTSTARMSESFSISPGIRPGLKEFESSRRELQERTSKSGLGRRLTAWRPADLPQNRAYRSVHGSSPVYATTDL